ncbi:hypothetical protein C0J52_01597 [Blattella germanica]|nr:hypothetical protein C0J52_01597 [Blattella germanica]
MVLSLREFPSDSLWRMVERQRNINQLSIVLTSWSVNEIGESPHFFNFTRHEMCDFNWTTQFLFKVWRKDGLLVKRTRETEDRRLYLEILITSNLKNNTHAHGASCNNVGLYYTVLEVDTMSSEIFVPMFLKTFVPIKSDVASPKSGPGTPASTVGGRCNSAGNSGGGGGGNTPGVDLGNLVECKQEPDSEFVDLEQCAAALEKDAAANGASFPGFSDLIGDDTSDEIITSDAFKDLISEISDFHPEFMKDFDFEDKSVDGLTNSNSASAVCPPAGVGGPLKVEDDNKDLHHAQQQQQQHQQPQHQNLMDVVGKPPGVNSPSPLMAGNPQYSPQPVYDPQSLSKSRMAPYPGLAELSPAAQTLKQMAEQHQHKTQLGMSFNPAAARNVRSPYGEFQFPPTGGNDYLGSPTGGAPNNAGAPTYLNKQGAGNSFVNSGTQAELIKQEVMFNASQTAFANNNMQELQKRQVMPQQASQQPQAPTVQQPQVAQQSANKPPGATGNPIMGATYNTAKQQYSPYGSPGPLPNHGSPQYLPRGQAPGGPGTVPQGAQHVGQFNSSTPPRPPSCPGSAGLQINQAQQMQINQQGQQIQHDHLNPLKYKLREQLCHVTRARLLLERTVESLLG